MKNCLFEKNMNKGGDGGGMYAIYNKECTIDGCVFGGNQAADYELAAGALYTVLSDISIVNSIFTHNTAGSVGGAIYNRQGGNLTITNCTFSNNESLAGGCITNHDGASATITNTILWGNPGPAELNGDGFTVSYSCITGGFPGQGNISVYPRFKGEDYPKGSNGVYGDFDDGLYLLDDSPCRESGTTQNAPDEDILFTHRPYYDNVDMGAYEYADFLDQKNIFGHLRNGQFIPKNDVDVLETLTHGKFVHLFSKSNYARVLRIKIPRNKHTEDDEEIHIYMRGIDILEAPLPSSEEVRIQLKRVSMDNNNIYFQSKTGSWGKYILFCREPYFQTWDNPWAYVIYVDNDANLAFRLPHSQFK